MTRKIFNCIYVSSFGIIYQQLKKIHESKICRGFKLQIKINLWTILPRLNFSEIKFLRILYLRGLVFSEFMDFLMIAKIYLQEVFVILHSAKIKPC